MEASVESPGAPTEIPTITPVNPATSPVIEQTPIETATPIQPVTQAPADSATPTPQATQQSAQGARPANDWTLTYGTPSISGDGCSSAKVDNPSVSVAFSEAPDRKSAQFGAQGLTVSMTGDGSGNYQGQYQTVSIGLRVSSPTQASGQMTTSVLGCTVSTPFQMSR